MNQKNENQLNLALTVPQQERQKTMDLDTGYDSGTGTWELIIRYSGNIQLRASQLGADLRLLSGGYALITIREDLVDVLAAYPEVIYIEKPKKLYYELDYSTSVSCIDPVWQAPESLSGAGVITALIDSGIDYSHPDFVNEDGTTRILYLYDETTNRIYDSAQINQALAAPVSERYQLVPERDVSGHGTHVAGIMAGNGRASQGRYRGVAYNSDLIVVKMGDDNYYSTARLMESVDYVITTAERLQRPIAVNLSFGNNYGSHDGSSLVETYLDYMAGRWENIIVAGTGNEAARGIHTYGVLGNRTIEKELIIGLYEPSINIQLWKNYSDEFNISLISPEEVIYGPFYKKDIITIFSTASSNIYVYYGEPSPYSVYQEIFIQFIPKSEYIRSGIWKIRLDPVRIADGRYDMWLPSGSAVSSDTSFPESVAEVTLTIPSTAQNVISVGAYNSRTLSYADFSGRGYTRINRIVKPELVAPGVNIMSAAVGGGYTARTGTSMAAPFVTGSGALLMEWGIIKGNDPYLYGDDCDIIGLNQRKARK